MKKDELLNIGLSEEQIQQIMVMSGKDIERHKTRITELETERDQTATQLQTATEALARFEGIDPAKIREEVETYKSKAAKAEENFKAQILKRDQQDWIDKKLDAYGVKSPYARKQLRADAMSKDSGLSWKDGSFFGFDDFMAAAKATDASLYETEDEKAAARKAADEAANGQKKSPSFVGPTGDGDAAERKYTPPKIF